MSTPEEMKNETAQTVESAAEKPVEKTEAAVSEAAAEASESAKKADEAAEAVPEKDWHDYIPKLLTVSPSRSAIRRTS